ncbi:hypothetical protein HDU82_000594 [Entophlyctis luteolus]|nr:hypothetical protein HDU82_000594 [Entophlyctis luteolus]
MNFSISLLKVAKLISCDNEDSNSLHGFSLTADGEYALQFQHLDVSLRMARFLLSAWKDPEITGSQTMKNYFATIAAILSIDAGKLLKPNFRYAKLHKSCRKLEICPNLPEGVLLPSTICKLNLFFAYYKIAKENRQRFCKRLAVNEEAIKDVNEIRLSILRRMQRFQPESSSDHDSVSVKSQYEIVSCILKHLSSNMVANLGVLCERNVSVGFYKNEKVVTATVDRKECQQFNDVKISRKRSTNVVLFHDLRNVHFAKVGFPKIQKLYVGHLDCLDGWMDDLSQIPENIRSLVVQPKIDSSSLIFLELIEYFSFL